MIVRNEPAKSLSFFLLLIFLVAFVLFSFQPDLVEAAAVKEIKWKIGDIEKCTISSL